ncbi:DUF2934 domain-containing protein [Thermochromatium tepidum]|uniref:DUF2934 domain-containing protein n=1 Tax=Thermochromatium tepidum ATCC 43061 TaxID=316276 RepID=A0A6I6E3K2_THETI|nr:DUF2934 domain-containing protein [Thermochromatium tepidum]QGU32332.1 DUF2934 domain-containing protein [Thermochromatium tepidum ATCC 43061]
MADDKIVTKKTAAKKAVTKKTTAIKGRASASGPSTTAAPDKPESAPVGKGTARSAGKRATTAKATPAATPKRGQSAASPSLSDHQGHLHELATVSEEKRQDMIREAAYYKAEKRNFAPGHEAEDWAMAEREIDELIARARAMTGH